MEYKIKKLQSGGGFATFTPIISNYPTTSTMGGQSAATTENSQSSIVDEKMIEHLYKQGGLVNDVNRLISEINKLEQSSDMPFLNHSNRSATLQIVSKINEVNQNKKYWEDAISRAKESGGLGEVAVDGGRIFVKTKDNKIQSLSLADYSAKRDKYRPLSVQELMYERQYNPSLTGQNAIFTVSDNAIGLNKITDHIKSLVSALGKETSETSKFYSKEEVKNYLASTNTKKPTAEEQASLSILNDIVNTPGEYAQVERKTESQRNQIGKALSYIWNTLGSPAQQKLAATAAINGVSNPKQFILEMLQSQTDYSDKTTITPKELPGSDKSKDKDTKTVALTPAELFHNDRLYRPGMTYEINNPAAGVSLNATATAIGALQNLTKPGETVGAGMISNIFNAANYRSMIDPGKAFIGDTKVDPARMREIAYTGDDVAKVYLPVKADGTPDLGQMERFNKAYQIFNANKDNWTTEQARKYFQKEGFSNVNIKEQPNQDGTVSKVIAENGSVRPFLALPIITNSASDLSENPWMVEMSGDQKDSAEVLMQEAFTTYGGTATKPKVIDNSPSAWNSLETPYKGTLFVAYRPESSAIISSMSGHLVGKSPTETDLYRNLNFSSASINPTGIQSSAMMLK